MKYSLVLISCYLGSISEAFKDHALGLDVVWPRDLELVSSKTIFSRATRPPRPEDRTSPGTRVQNAGARNNGGGETGQRGSRIADNEHGSPGRVGGQRIPIPTRAPDASAARGRIVRSGGRNTDVNRGSGGRNPAGGLPPLPNRSQYRGAEFHNAANHPRPSGSSGVIPIFPTNARTAAISYGHSHVSQYAHDRGDPLMRYREEISSPRQPVSMATGATESVHSQTRISRGHTDLMAEGNRVASASVHTGHGSEAHVLGIGSGSAQESHIGENSQAHVQVENWEEGGTARAKASIRGQGFAEVSGRGR